MIRKYDKVEDILEEFYHFRLKMYTERKVRLSLETSCWFAC